MKARPRISGVLKKAVAEGVKRIPALKKIEAYIRVVTNWLILDLSYRFPVVQSKLPRMALPRIPRINVR